MSDYLGDELVTDILTRVPVKHILRFMCVCKSWKSLISSTYFISSQLRYSEKNNTQIIVQQRSIIDEPSRLFYLDDPRVNSHYQSLVLNLGLKDPLEIVGSVNGLICFAHIQGNKYQFIIFNPEIGSFLVVPSPTPLFSRTVIRGFGFDDTTLDHTIFITESESHVYLYSLNSNYWKFINCQESRFSSHSSSSCAVFVNGCFHWVAEDYPGDHPPFIMLFDIKSETFGRIFFEEWLRGSLGIIKGFGESPIGVIQYLGGNLNHVWIIEQNGSWVKIAENVSVGNSRPADLSEHDTEKVLGFRNKDELLISFYNRGGIVSQNIKNKEVHTLITREEEGFFIFEVHSHVPSIVSLDRT